MNAKETKISSFGRAERILTGVALRPLLRHELVSSATDTMRTVEELLQQGTGAVFLFNHFGLLDGPVLAHYLLTNPVIRQRHVLFPIARHQYDGKFGFLIKGVGSLAKLELYPIVNSDTLTNEGYENQEINQGMDEYLMRSSKVLKSGGVVGLSPQTGRRETLGQPTNALGLFMAKMITRGVGDYALIPVEMGTKGSTNYTIKELDLTDTYTIHLGPCVMASKVLGGTPSREVLPETRNVDAWAIDQLGRVVPQEYLG